MLDNLFVKKLDAAACLEHIEFHGHDLEVTERRIKAIRKKQQTNPEFKAYDKWADDMVDIDTRLEEQLAVRDEIEADLIMLRLKLDSLTLKKEHPNCKLFNSQVAQLSLLDMGMSC